MAAAMAVDFARIALPVAGRTLPQWRVVAGLTAALCMVYSAVSSFETATANRADAASAKTGANEDRDRTQADYDRAVRALAKLPVARSEFELNSVLVDIGQQVPMTVWRKTDGCQTVTLDASRTACAPALALFAEREIAKQRASVEHDMKAAADKLASMPAAITSDAGAALTADLPFTLTPHQARLVGSLVQILTFELLASVLLSMAAAAWAAAMQGRASNAAEEQQLDAEPPCSPVEPPARTGGPMAAQPQPGSPAGRQWATNEPPAGVAALQRLLSEIGGTFTGSQRDLAQLIGCNRTAAQRLLTAAARQGIVGLSTVRGHQTTVALLRPMTVAA